MPYIPICRVIDEVNNLALASRTSGERIPLTANHSNKGATGQNFGGFFVSCDERAKSGRWLTLFFVQIVGGLYWIDDRFISNASAKSKASYIPIVEKILSTLGFRAAGLQLMTVGRLEKNPNGYDEHRVVFHQATLDYVREEARNSQDGKNPYEPDFINPIAQSYWFEISENSLIETWNRAYLDSRKEC